MQWLKKKEAQEPDDYWREVEVRRGGPVTFSTFATLIGHSGAGRVDLPGLLYVANSVVWFEDFERDNWLYRLMGGNRKYQKTEVSFPLADVIHVRLVSKARGDRCVAGAAAADALPAASRISQFFSSPFVLVTLKDGSAVVFDMLERRRFAALFPAP